MRYNIPNCPYQKDMKQVSYVGSIYITNRYYKFYNKNLVKEFTTSHKICSSHSLMSSI